MAEGLLRSRVPDELSAVIVARSAGTAGFDDVPATAHAVAVMGQHGVDISAHRSCGFDAAAAEAADLILAMTAIHVDEIAEAAPQARHKIHLLSEFAGGSSRDVPDPIGGPREEYEQVFDLLSDLIDRSLPRIVSLAKEKRT
jgi:protein-tyrosine-phosphatase